MNEKISIHACIWSDDIHVMLPPRLIKSFSEFLVNSGAKEIHFLESAANVFREMDKKDAANCNASCCEHNKGQCPTVKRE